MCEYCLEEPGLVEFIRNNAFANECSFCARKDHLPIAAPIDEVSTHFIRCLFREYDLAVELLGWMGSDEGFFGQHWVAEDLAFEELELEFPQDNQDQLLPQLFGEYYDQDWCEENPYGLNYEERTRFSWNRFCEVVMHERRYFFLGEHQESNDSEVYSPRQVLNTIFEYAQEMGLFKSLPAGSHLVRVRCENSGPPLKAPQDLGPPPPELATQSNRMSPAGIPMFYGCDDEETALKETSASPGMYAVGKFETLRPMTVLDLTDIPPIPSLFEQISDAAEVIPRRALTFLHHIAKEISRSIDRDNRTHINYVPTQVVTEFIRDQLTWGDTRIDGVKYESSVHPGHVSYVLFANDYNVESASHKPFRYDPWLKLVDLTHRICQ